MMLSTTSVTARTSAWFMGEDISTETTVVRFQPGTTWPRIVSTCIAFAEINNMLYFKPCVIPSLPILCFKPCPGNVARTRLTLRLRRSVAFLTKRDFLASVELSLSLRFSCENVHNRDIKHIHIHIQLYGYRPSEKLSADIHVDHS